MIILFASKSTPCHRIHCIAFTIFELAIVVACEVGNFRMFVESFSKTFPLLFWEKKLNEGLPMLSASSIVRFHALTF